MPPPFSSHRLRPTRHGGRPVKQEPPCRNSRCPISSSAMEAAGMLVRVKEEKRVDELPRVMEDHPKTAVLVEKITGCEFSFLANALFEPGPIRLGDGLQEVRDRDEDGRGLARDVSSQSLSALRHARKSSLKGDDVDMTIFPMFLHHERDGQSYSDDNLVFRRTPTRASTIGVSIGPCSAPRTSAGSI